MGRDEPGMPAHEVVTVTGHLATEGIVHQVNGGWAVDALLGRQTRPHRDLDVFLDETALDAVIAWLEGRGYATETDHLPARLELRRGAWRVDLHPMRLDAGGNGVQRGERGEVYAHPAADRTTGLVAGRQVTVASAARLRELRRGYPPRPEDVHDLTVLDALLSGP